MSEEQLRFFNEVIRPRLIQMALDGDSALSDLNELSSAHFDEAANVFNNSEESYEPNRYTMRTFNIIFMDGYNEVQNLDTNEPIFSTKGIDPEVIDNIVNIWNKTGSVNVNLYSGGEVDDYLLNEDKCSQEDREHITEALYMHGQR